jgi:hypothetical protein
MPGIKELNAEPIPGYRLLSPLGSGGFGEVWKCEAPGGIYKAIKFVYGNLNILDNEAARAAQELQALERVKNIRHPFILTIERVEKVNGELIIVMELADQDLRDVYAKCRNKGYPGIDRDELLQYLRDVAEALDLMNHQHNLQHLDIKPSNLFVVSNRVKVADFGLVKALEGRTSISPSTGLLGGVTPLYAAPETFQGCISPHSDQYSLAIVYQELLTGQLPFNGRNARQLMIQHVQAEPNLEPLPLADRCILARALSKKPEDRFPSCMEFIRALIQASSGQRAWSTMEDMFLESEPPQPQLNAEETEQAELSAVSASTPSGDAAAGTLRPTLLLGLGCFGREALQALRCRVVDRFGSLTKLPIWRFLLMDTDQRELHRATIGPPEQTLGQQETHHVALPPISHFRRTRQAIEQLNEWLPVEKLYALPRTPATQGVRAYGRLAFQESYLRIASRLKKELEILADEETVKQAVAETGLSVRMSAPQVYIFAATGGGTGSGMLLDTAYTIRRALMELGLPERDVVAFLMCGAPTDPASPPEERANTFATLTEIQHYVDPAVEFHAQYGVNGPQLRDRGSPFRSVYLTRVGHRGPNVVREAASRLASYVFHDLSSPMGIFLAQGRRLQRRTQDTVFRSFGTYSVWFPRGLMLRVAARLACQRLIHQWLSPAPSASPCQAAALRACEQTLYASEWDKEFVRQRIESATTHFNEGPTSQSMTSFLASLEMEAESAVARDDPGGWCHGALKRVKEWVGGGTSRQISEWQQSRVNRVYSQAAQRVAEEYVEQMRNPASALFNQPGLRHAGAEGVYAHLYEVLVKLTENQHNVVRSERALSEKYWDQANEAFQSCLRPGSFFIFGGMRTQKLLRHFVERVVTFARQRLVEQSHRALEEFYKILTSRLQDLKHDLTFCTQRLRHVEESLMEVPPEEEAALSSASMDLLEPSPAHHHISSSQVLRDTAVVLASRIVLPEGITDLESAATRFLASLHLNDWKELDLYLQQYVLDPLGGLYHLCLANSELTRTLNVPLLDRTAEFLDRHLAVTDVCLAELSSAESLHVDISMQCKAYHHLATPAFVGRKSAVEQTFLLIPGTQAGVHFAELAKAGLPDIQPVAISQTTDILICREQPNLGPDDLREVFAACREAYDQQIVTPLSSPHSRSDVSEWLPLDPMT